jgi:hypothetical protein
MLFLKKFISVCIAFLCVISSCSNVGHESPYPRIETCDVEVSIEYFGIICPVKKIPDTLLIKVKRNLFCKAFISSCDGDMRIMALDSNGVILTEGLYKSSNDTVNTFAITESPGSDKMKTNKSKYLKPKRDGDWLFYDKNGNFEKKETYKDGLLIR